ncbi:hypothetical protein AMTR_s00014p00214790 [Amborella trichopoda]|uniref:Uncharacterized protein n=1 Tax=Amborella trichopoda TaxID=13333 RepID=W1PM77_AMBTC|nr:hypothetical protein AMTR_s00014p00214790 [Amborella trichopoda]
MVFTIHFEKKYRKKGALHDHGALGVSSARPRRGKKAPAIVEPRRTSPPPPTAKRMRVEACIVSTPPPAAITPAPRVEPETIVAWPKKSRLTSFSLRRKLRWIPSRVVAVVTPPFGSPVGSPACSSLSSKGLLCAFAKEGNGEAIGEVSSAEAVASKVLAPTAPAVELEVEPPLKVPPSELEMGDDPRTSLGVNLDSSMHDSNAL